MTFDGINAQFRQAQVTRVWWVQFAAAWSRIGWIYYADQMRGKR